MPTPTLGGHRLLLTAVTSPPRRLTVSTGLVKVTCMIAALLAAPCLSPAQESRFVTLQLPLKVAVKVPANWRPLTADERANVETTSEAALNLAHIAIPRGEAVNLFRANSTPPTTYAAIAITVTDADSVDLQALETATDAEVSQLSSILEPGVRRSLSAFGQELVRFVGVHRVMVGGHLALVTEYSRTGPKGPVLVQVTSLYLDAKEMRLTLSYRESEAAMWQPIVTYIGQSLSVGGDSTRGRGGPAQASYKPPTEADAPPERLTEAFVSIALGILTIALAAWPAIILNRKMLVKAPRRRSFAWGYFLALAVLLIGILSLGVAFIDSEDRGLLIASGVTACLLAAMLLRRNRWAWLAFVILQLNPLAWIVNGIYLKNRWGEMRADA